MISSTFQELGLDEETSQRGTSLVRLLTSHDELWQVESEPESLTGSERAQKIIASWLQDSELQRF